MIRSTPLALTLAVALGASSALVHAASSEQPSVPLPPSSQSPPSPGPAAGGAGNESSGIKQTVTDAGITTKLKAKLLTDEMTSGMKIHVDTDNGIVALTGQAQTPAEKARAEELAMATNGVVKVDNRLIVQAQ